MLASSRAISAEQADRPYYLPARIAAAATAPAVQRPGVLREALAVMPGDSLRLHLFRAEFALGHMERALAAIQPLLENPAGHGQQPDADSDTETDTETADSPQAADEQPQDLQTEANDTPNTDTFSNGNASGAADDDDTDTQAAKAGIPLPTMLATNADRVDFALAVATLLEHLDKAERALQFAQAASFYNKISTRDAEIARRIDLLQARVQRQQENTARRPVIHEALDQAVVVRPRIQGNEAVLQQVHP